MICNSGFELISECLQWRKPVLTKPLTGQMEQLSNALALAQLGHATVVPRLDTESLGPWLLQRPAPPALRFADVADALAGWLAAGAHTEIGTLQQQLWRDTARNTEAHTGAPIRPARMVTSPSWPPQRQRVELGNMAGMG